MKIETKFDLEQNVFMIGRDNKIKEVKVNRILMDFEYGYKPSIKYTLYDEKKVSFERSPEKLFKTKEDAMIAILKENGMDIGLINKG